MTAQPDVDVDLEDRVAAARDSLAANGVPIDDDLLARLVHERTRQAKARQAGTTSYRDPTGDAAVARAMRSSR